MSMSYMDFLRFGLGHLDQLPVFVAAADGIANGATARAKWDAAKPAGDVLADDVDELVKINKVPLTGPGSDVNTVEGQLVEALNLKVAQSLNAKGAVLTWDGSRLRALWSVLEPVLSKLLPLLISLIPKA